jgi:uncharacterized ion transporter superfamily protein YfcC
MPHTFVLLTALLLVAALIGHLLPAGRYERTARGNRELVDPTSFHYVEGHPAGIEDVLLAFPRGLRAASELVFAFLILGGALGVVTKTGVVDVIISGSVALTKGRGEVLIPLLMVGFSLGGATLGLAGEILPFLPGLVLLARRLGYDSLTGVAIAVLGAGAGVSGAFLSPFTLGFAQQLAGLPLFSGILFRLVVWLVLTVVTVTYVYRHAIQTRGPSTPELMSTNSTSSDNRGFLLIAVVVLGVLVMAWGTLRAGWGLLEISGLYLAVAVVSATVAGLSPNETAVAFSTGAAGMTSAALVVGLARGAPLLLDSAGVTDTILHGATVFVQALPSSARVVGIYLMQVAVSFVVPSSIAQAALTIPIVAPLGDLVGVTRQTNVLAFQFGDAFSNVLSPNVGYFMAALAMTETEWVRWARFVVPLFGIWCIVGLVFVLIANAVHLGPF